MVTMDQLLDGGESHWPGLGRFTLVLTAPTPRAQPATLELGVLDFGRRDVEFKADDPPAVLAQVTAEGGVVRLAGFGDFRVRGTRVVFSAAPALRARLSRTAPNLVRSHP
jgi:hypothetical protein